MPTGLYLLRLQGRTSQIGVRPGTYFGWVIDLTHEVKNDETWQLREEPPLCPKTTRSHFQSNSKKWARR